MHDRATRPAARRRRRLGLVSIAALAAVAALPWPVAAADEPTPTPTATATPTPTPTTEPTPTPGPTPTPTAALTPTPTAGPTAVPLPTPRFRAAPTATAGPGSTPRPLAPPAPAPTMVTTTNMRYSSTRLSAAMVKQYTNYYCVPATTQSMVNLIKGTSNRTRATQDAYYKGTRAHNRYRYETKGNDPVGWAWAVRNYSGRTGYQARAFTNKTLALNAIVDAIGRTGNPVGVPVRGGTHAWVVLGYRISSDPTEPSKRTILGYYVSGPLGSPTDPWVSEYMTQADFRNVFTQYHEWQFPVVWEDRWVIISE